MAWIESLSRHGCARCEAGEGCGGGIFAKLFGDKQFRMEIANTLNLEQGDNVVIGIPENSITMASFWSYLLPLLGLISGASLGNLIDEPDSEFWTLLVSLCGLLLSLIVGKLRVNSKNFLNQYTPQMLRKEITLQQFEPSSL